MTLNEKLKEIEARLEKATPGPWRAVRNNALGETWFNIFSLGDNNVLAMIGDLADEVKQSPDADLIAHAPTDLALLLSLVKEYRAALEQIDSEWCPHSNIRLDQNENLSRDWCCACSNWIYRGETNLARDALRRGEGMG